jgi:hypothetical protein
MNYVRLKYKQKEKLYKERAMRGTFACVITCVIVGLFFLSATAANALVAIEGQCMDDCYNEGNVYEVCLKKCVAKSESSDSDKKPKFHSECLMPCRNQGNTHDFCKSLCTY